MTAQIAKSSSNGRTARSMPGYMKTFSSDIGIRGGMEREATSSPFQPVEESPGISRREISTHLRSPSEVAKIMSSHQRKGNSLLSVTPIRICGSAWGRTTISFSLRWTEATSNVSRQTKRTITPPVILRTTAGWPISPWPGQDSRPTNGMSSSMTAQPRRTRI